MAKLDKAPVYETGDYRFESCRVRHFFTSFSSLDDFPLCGFLRVTCFALTCILGRYLFVSALFIPTFFIPALFVPTLFVWFFLLPRPALPPRVDNVPGLKPRIA